MKEGKFLEMLVECLQKLLASDGITVTRNEKFRSKGKQVGEVDVVLRGKFGSTNMVVGIECRDRKGPQGRDWIQQIMGKRDDLAEFGFRHWIAVSSSGFASTAEALAKKANIELLVPGKVRVMEPGKPGLHTWMSFVIDYPMWRLGHQVSAKIEYDSEEAFAQISEQINKTGSDAVRICTSGMEPMSLHDFNKPTVDAYGQDNQVIANGAETESRMFTFTNLESVINGIRFKISELELEIISCEETFIPEFRVMAFTIPGTQDILGFIGINEYNIQSNTRYLMVAVKPDDLGNAVIVQRDSEGNPLTNKILFPVYAYPPGTPIKIINYRVAP
jgi:hypothetical protein